MLYVFAGTLLIILSFSINVMAQDKIPHAGIIADSFEIEDPKEPDTLKSGRLRAIVCLQNMMQEMMVL